MVAQDTEHEDEMAAKDLDTLQSQFPACKVVAYADISTRMVLVTNADSTLDRAALDDLCAEAVLLLSADGTPEIGTTTSNSAVRRTQKESVVFVRSTDEPNDVLICVCDPTLEIGGFLPEALVCLNKFGQE